MHRRLSLLPLLALASACDRPPSAPLPLVADPPQAPVLAVQCQAAVASRVVTCSTPVAGGRGLRADVLLGGQNLYITLASSNVQVYADTFAFDVTVRNRIPQPLGTTDGATPDPSGVRVFFHQGPTVTGGSGQIVVANPDGLGTFTASNQPYFQYAGMLAQNQTSTPRRWKLRFDPGVDSFSFTVYVSTALQYPDGWIDVSPATLAIVTGTTVQLTGVVRDFVGRAVTGAAIAWSSADSSVARVDAASGSLLAVHDGATVVIAASGARSGRASVSVATPTRYAVVLDHAAITAGDTVLVAAQLLDGNGTPLAAPGRVVTWSASPSGGFFSQATSATDGAGIARVRFRASTVVGVHHTVTATDGDGVTGTSSEVVTTGGQVVPVF